MNSKPSLHNKVAKLIKTICFSLFSYTFLICATPQTSFGYDNDTHFWLTYYLARKAGYTNVQATQIASANVSVDYDPDTEPVLAKFNHWRDFFQPISHFQNVVDTFHALPSKVYVNINAKVNNDFWWDPTFETESHIQDEADKSVRCTKDKFWGKTILYETNPGVFLHYEQDVYAHKKFKSWIGHGGYYYVDFLASNPAEAERMALNSLKYLIIHRKYQAEKKLNSKFLKTKNVDDIDINDFAAQNDISLKDIIDIKNTVERFVNENSILDKRAKIVNGYKYAETSIIEKWRNFSHEKKKRHYKLIPLTYIPDLWRNKTMQPTPNSCKARNIVKEELKILDKELPHIWRFDLKNSREDYLERTNTNQAFVYKSCNHASLNNENMRYLIKNEIANKELEKMCSSNQKYYLSFALKDNLYKLPSDIRPCK